MLRRFILSLLTSSLMLAPVFVRANDFDAGMKDDCKNMVMFSTPYSAKGRFVFVTRVSRRVLRELVALHQQPYRPAGIRLEI